MKTQLSTLIAKSNVLVEAAYKLTLGEQRLLLAVATVIDTHPDKPAVTGETPIDIPAEAIVDLFEIPQKKAYELLTDAAERLAERWVIIDYPDPLPEDKDLTRTKTRWVSAISYLPGRGSVRLYLAPKIIPFMNKLSGEFTRYRLQHVAPMTSVYAIRLYELLIQWQMQGEREVTIEWLKKQFMIPDNYSRLFNLKRRVIQPAIDQINEHSNLWVKYTQKKSGRNVVALQFQFGHKDCQTPTKATKPKALPSPAAQPPAVAPPKPRARTDAERAIAQAAIAEAKRKLK
jgi:plasmid replication initiation protein